VAVIVRTQGGLAGLVQHGRRAVIETLVDLDEAVPQPSAVMAAANRAR